MTTPYREKVSFTVLGGARALAVLKRATRPGIDGIEAVAAIGAIALVPALVHPSMRFLPTALVGSVLAVSTFVVSRRRAAAIASDARALAWRGTADDRGVRVERDGGAWDRWSWDRITHAQRIGESLAIFTDTAYGIAVSSETEADLDRLAAVVRDRARARWRAPFRWMSVVVLAYVALTFGAFVVPRDEATPRARIEVALDEGREPAREDVDALSWGDACTRAELHELFADYRRTPLAWTDAIDDAAMRVALHLDPCRADAIEPRGRVVVDDRSRGSVEYYVFTLDGDARWATVGPYPASLVAFGPWADLWSEPFDTDQAIRRATADYRHFVGGDPRAHYEDAVDDLDE